jgi:hypothetical protein
VFLDLLQLNLAESPVFAHEPTLFCGKCRGSLIDKPSNALDLVTRLFDIA